MTDIMPFLNSIHHFGHFLFSVLFKLRVLEEANVPRRGGLIIACNHISELDPPVLGCSIPRQVNIMAKVELFRTRLGSFYLPRIGAFPVNRDGVDTTSFRKALEITRRGGAVVVFPEGTRSKDGRPLPVKPGIGLLAARTAVPVLPSFIWGTDHPFRALVGKTGFSVRFGGTISKETIAGARSEGGIRKVAELIMSSIERIGTEAVLIK